MGKNLNKELKHIISKNWKNIGFLEIHNLEKFIIFKNEWINRKVQTYYHKSINVEINEMKRIFEISEILNISYENLRIIWKDVVKERKEIELIYNGKPKVERRDNKDVRVGSGSSYRGNRVRYPSKKRSVSTWRNFYKLFPELAKNDNFDGRTSDKMK